MADLSASTTPSAQGLLHEALLYRGKGELSSAVSAFVDEALSSGEPVLLALPGEHLEQIGRLPAGVPSLAYEDMREVGLNPNRVLPLMEGWIGDHGAGGVGRVRIVCELVWPGRTYPEAAECLRHEALVNTVLAEAPATLFCPYDAVNLEAETIAGAELTHPTVVDGDRRRPSLAYQALAGLDLDAIWPLEPPAAEVHAHDLGASLGELRSAVSEDPLLDSLSPHRRSDLVLAVNEAATNAVKHAHGTCTARIWHDGRDLVTEITSETAVGDPLAGRCPRPDPVADSGRGLWLINQVCDLVEMRSGEGGTTLRLHMRGDA